jgi:NADPH:quinone reductase-like Zn-dependent oxidoreductase
VLNSGETDGRWVAPVDRIVKARLIEAGRVSPVIERTYPLAEVPDAVRHVEQGHTRGKVVIAV